MNLRIIFVLLFYLTACKAQQPVDVKQEPKTEIKKTKIEEKKVSEPVSTPKQGSFNLFLLLPVDLAEAFTLDSIVLDSSYVTEAIDKDIRANIDFYEGALLAIDSLRKTGADIKLKVVDLPGNDEQQVSAVWKIDFSMCDMVFSMLRSKPLSTLNEILLTKNIPLISSAPNSYAQIEKNKNAICVQPSSLTQCRMMGEFAGSNFKSDNIIVVTSSLEKEQERANAYVRGVEKNNPAAQIKKVNLALEGMSVFNKALSGTGTNTIFVPSADEDFVSTVFAAIESALSIYHFKVIGLPVWQHFESLDPVMMEKFNTLIFSPDNISFSSAPVIKFRDKFRQNYSTEPGDAAYLAFDSFLLFGNLLSKGELDKAEIKFNGLRSKYYFLRENHETVLENQFIYILKLEDFQYVKVTQE